MGMPLIDETTPGLLAGLLPAVADELRRADVAARDPRPRTLGVPDGAKAAVVAALYGIGDDNGAAAAR